MLANLIILNRLTFVNRSGLFRASPLQIKLKELEPLHGQYSVHVLCEALGVARGTFYNHIFRNKRANTNYQIRRDKLSEQIKQIYDDSNQIFGARKIRAVLASRGIPSSDKMVSELMQEMNLYSIRTGAKKNHSKLENKEKTEFTHKLNFLVKAPNEVWVSDVTCFKVNQRFQYICAIID